AILPVVQKQHQLLVTLLLCNACAMEALPLYLDKLVNQFLAIVLSVTFVLFFGEVIPQAICTRYGLAVGANFVWLVRILLIICYPIAYPIGKVLDYLLGHNEVLFRRAQLKALVSIHSKEAGKGGDLTHDETTIISGALDLTEKVKSLLTVRAETETPVSAVSIRRIPRVPCDMPLYDILNEFQKGSSHMAAVVRTRAKSKSPTRNHEEEPRNYNNATTEDSALTTPLLPKEEESSEKTVIDIEKTWKAITMNGQAATNFPSNVEDGEVVGIITLEDVFEELLQEEIVDETDVYVDVHNQIRVAAAAAASSIARAPSMRRLNKAPISFP
uniref:CNNM transmembrane domain-containing protein n=1 Tax=Chenopodium quinoa TaxID=63459 RepID=A0A803N0V6_CHEQI